MVEPKKPIMMVEGNWYKPHNVWRAPQEGDVFLNSCGNLQEANCSMGGVGPRTILTPIPTPVEWKLGKNVLASVKPDEQPNVTGDFRATNGIERHWQYGKVYEKCSTEDQVIILGPPPAPQKTADELLDEIDARILGIADAKKNYQKLRDIQEMIRDYKSKPE